MGAHSGKPKRMDLTHVEKGIQCANAKCLLSGERNAQTLILFTLEV